MLIKIGKKHRDFYVSSTILSASAILTYIYLVLIATIKSRCYYPHFADKKTEAQKPLLKVTELTSGRAGIAA